MRTTWKPTKKHTGKYSAKDKFTQQIKITVVKKAKPKK